MRLNLFTSDGRRLQAVEAGTAYASPDGRLVNVTSSMGVLFSDDFGGSAVDTTRWDVYDGGLGAVTQSTGAQGAIGSGVTGITDGVANSALTVVMGTINNAERWYLSKQTFAGAEDVTVVLSRSQALTANSFFIGLVEVDVATGYPILNPNLAGDFTNRGGMEFGQTSSSGAASLQAVADSSNGVASVGPNSFSPTAMSNLTEALIEFHAEDIIASACAPDAANARSAAIRVSSQCPNDGRAYKLLIRAKNVATPGSSTSFVIARILVVNNQEARVSVNSSGSQSPQQGVPVNAQAQGAVGSNVALTNVSPVTMGVQARSDSGVAVATTRNAYVVGDLAGRMVNQPLGNPGTHDFNRVTVTTTTETTLVAATASNRNLLHTLTIANMDTAACKVDLRDASGGTIRASFVAAAGSTLHVPYPAGLPAAAANTAWTVQLRAATTANAVEISASSFRTAA